MWVTPLIIPLSVNYWELVPNVYVMCIVYNTQSLAHWNGYHSLISTHISSVFSSQLTCYIQYRLSLGIYVPYPLIALIRNFISSSRCFFQSDRSYNKHQHHIERTQSNCTPNLNGVQSSHKFSPISMSSTTDILRSFSLHDKESVQRLMKRRVEINDDLKERNTQLLRLLYDEWVSDCMHLLIQLYRIRRTRLYFIVLPDDSVINSIPDVLLHLDEILWWFPRSRNWPVSHRKVMKSWMQNWVDRCNRWKIHRIPSPSSWYTEPVMSAKRNEIHP